MSAYWQRFDSDMAGIHAWSDYISEMVHVTSDETLLGVGQMHRMSMNDRDGSALSAYTYCRHESQFSCIR
jgi:hypothetical protein